MRHGKPCPKCNSISIIRIPGVVLGYGAGNNIPMHRKWFAKPVLVTRYMCEACGFSEEWIDDPDDIAKIKAGFGM